MYKIDSREFREKVNNYLEYDIQKENLFLDLKIPEKLYKHMGLNEYSIKNLKDEKLYASTPLNYNDVFDSRENNLYCDTEAYKEFENNIFRHDENRIAQKIVHSRNYMSKSFKIICFTEEFNSNLMWAHYSENHTGICVEYNLKNQDIEKRIIPVSYLENPIDTKSLKKRKNNKENELEQINLINVVSKSDIWKYEKEWRCIYEFVEGSQSKGYTIKIPKTSIKEIILGARFFECMEYLTGDEVRERIKMVKKLFEYISNNKLNVYILIPTIDLYRLDKYEVDSAKILNLLSNKRSKDKLISEWKEMQMKFFEKKIKYKNYELFCEV